VNRSIYLARLLGSTLAIVGLSIILRADHFSSVLKAFDNSALLYLSGLLALSFGLAVVIGHNVWRFSWRTLITLVGWIAVAKGIAILFAPSHMGALTDKVIATPDALLGSAAFDCVLGAILGICGFLAKPEKPQKP